MKNHLLDFKLRSYRVDITRRLSGTKIAKDISLGSIYSPVFNRNQLSLEKDKFSCFESGQKNIELRQLELARQQARQAPTNASVHKIR